MRDEEVVALDAPLGPRPLPRPTAQVFDVDAVVHHPQRAGLGQVRPAPDEVAAGAVIDQHVQVAGVVQWHGVVGDRSQRDALPRRVVMAQHDGHARGEGVFLPAWAASGALNRVPALSSTTRSWVSHSRRMVS
jgi:hypothetical protein